MDLGIRALGLVALVSLATSCDSGSSHRFPPPPTAPTVEARAIDGAGNNLSTTTMGSTDVALLRMTTPAYGDGVSTPAGATRPSARAVSNAIHVQSTPLPNALDATDLFWLWGQFVDHDIDLTEPRDPAEAFPIAVPMGDPLFDPMNTGTQTIALDRSSYVSGSSPRQQRNQITAWLDGSVVYGSDLARTTALRANDGTGRLRVDASGNVGDLLPRNTGGLPNAMSATDPTLFLAGDVRANENVLLTAMHTLWVREHNRLADEYRQRYPTATGDEIFQLARRWVGAEIQAITYEEWLPILLGPGGMPNYAGYDSLQQAGIFNEFSTACYRFGHSLLSGQLLRLDASLSPIAQGHLALRDGFFQPDRLLTGGGIEPLLRGASQQVCQELDVCVVDDVRNFLFGPPGSGGLDLAALNIQRGRDHGLPAYNEVRRQLNLLPKAAFTDVSSNPTVQTALMNAYADVEQIDLWTGALAEPHLPGAMVGELLAHVLGRQFQVIRDCDRFFYMNVFTGSELAELRATRLSDVIRRNTTIDTELQNAVFLR